MLGFRDTSRRSLFLCVFSLSHTYTPFCSFIIFGDLGDAIYRTYNLITVGTRACQQFLTLFVYWSSGWMLSKGFGKGDGRYQSRKEKSPFARGERTDGHKFFWTECTVQATKPTRCMTGTECANCGLMGRWHLFGVDLEPDRLRLGSTRYERSAILGLGLDVVAS